MTTVSIVIPTFGHWELTHALLLDIKQHNDGADEIIVINDGSHDIDVFNGVDWWKKTLLPQIKFLNLKENCGFLKACNEGVARATGDVVILVSNDVQMKEDIVSLVKQTVTAVTKVVMGGILYENSTGWNEFKKGKRKKIFPYLEGWLLIFPKKAWNEVGGFDEQYAPNDFEDVDISTAWASAGYKLIPLSTTRVRHIGAQTYGYNPARLELTKRNRQLFADKWDVEYYDVG